MSRATPPRGYYLAVDDEDDDMPTLRLCQAATLARVEPETLAHIARSGSTLPPLVTLADGAPGWRGWRTVRAVRAWAASIATAHQRATHTTTPGDHHHAHP